MEPSFYSLHTHNVFRKRLWREREALTTSNDPEGDTWTLFVGLFRRKICSTAPPVDKTPHSTQKHFIEHSNARAPYLRRDGGVTEGRRRREEERHSGGRTS